MNELTNPLAEPQQDPELLTSLGGKVGLVRDCVKRVALGYTTGCYTYGPPGTGKTYLTQDTLEQVGVKPVYLNGFSTTAGLAESLRANNTSIIVIDDVPNLGKDERALAILMAATWGKPGTGRTVSYVKAGQAGQSSTFTFSGGIIMLSNIPLRSRYAQQALESRVDVQQFDPSQEELFAFVRDHYLDGYHAERGEHSLSGDECAVVIDHVIAQCCLNSSRFDLRKIVKAFAQFAQWRNGDAESDWRDSVASTVVGHTSDIRHTLVAGDEQRAEDLATLSSILDTTDDPKEQVRLWEQRTGLSRRTFYRRKGELSGLTVESA